MGREKSTKRGKATDADAPQAQRDEYRLPCSARPAATYAQRGACYRAAAVSADAANAGTPCAARRVFSCWRRA